MTEDKTNVDATEITEVVEDAKVEETAEAPKAIEAAGEPVEIPAKFKDLVEQVEKMSVLELSELVKLLEKKFGVTAQAAVMAAPAGGAAADDREEQTSFGVELKTAGDQKIQVIKVLKEALGLGLKEAKELAESAPAMIKEGLDKAAAEELKAKLIEAGASVDIK